MTRNLDHRIEIAVPVEDGRLQASLSTSFDVLLADKTAWVLRSDGSWKRLAAKGKERARGSHEKLMRKATARTRPRSVARRQR
jgi:polyphosphate kinase